MRYISSIIGGKRLKGVDSIPSESKPLHLSPEGKLVLGDGTALGGDLAERLVALEAFINSSNVIAFENVDAVAIDYTDQDWHPNPSVFLLNEFGGFDQAFPVLTYNSVQQELVVSFAGDVVSGYLILN